MIVGRFLSNTILTKLFMLIAKGQIKAKKIEYPMTHVEILNYL